MEKLRCSVSKIGQRRAYGPRVAGRLLVADRVYIYRLRRLYHSLSSCETSPSLVGWMKLLEMDLRIHKLCLRQHLPPNFGG